jgi:hypothetical protein
MLLDLLLVDYALKMHHGNFGGTHGRSYVKDKVSATKQDAFNGCKLLFDDTELDYSSVSAPDASLLARSRRYRLPPVIRDIATHPMTMVDRQRMNVALDEKPTDNADDPLPDAPYGLDFDDEANLSFWWSMGSQTLWVNLRLLFEVAERENLWDAQLADYKVLRDLVWVDGDIEATLANAHAALKLIWPMANLALLNEVNTYTYRTPQYMLSTAQDYRKGLRGAQTHISQATLSEHAIVFTQHPAYLPVAAGDDVPPDWNWQKEDEPGPGYWTGDGANPRSAQHRNVAIHIYWPQYPSTPPLGFGYREETHAYFPHAHFDEVVQEGSWTFGRKNDAYVALYSWRATAWRSGQPEVFENAGMPFDLVAGGSARNVWIVECSSAPEWGSFAAFRAAFQTASVDVTENDASAPDGYDVQYVSPSQGIIRFGWHEPLVVNGLEIPIGDYPRFDNPFVQSDFDSQRYEIRTRRNALTLDFATGLRRIGGPRPLSRSFF